MQIWFYYIILKVPCCYYLKNKNKNKPEKTLFAAWLFIHLFKWIQLLLSWWVNFQRNFNLLWRSLLTEVTFLTSWVIPWLWLCLCYGMIKKTPLHPFPLYYPNQLLSSGGHTSHFSSVLLYVWVRWLLAIKAYHLLGDFSYSISWLFDLVASL